ncbi:CEP104 [Acanthosepion pharaonis]|uniref:CEP104 n=1 Tax=Acanthosepion pharaonis TaxID=158019 RepID=A0A812CCJ4_ACAPH|nr:CEP104 [Sepia pharaonis]
MSINFLPLDDEKTRKNTLTKNNNRKNPTQKENLKRIQDNLATLIFILILYPRKIKARKRVVEIAMFKKHLLTECTAKDSYRNCPRCQGAVLKSNYDAHISDRSCKVIDATETLCPLCHMKIKPSDEGWKQHLMAACKNNPRLNLTQSKNQTASSGRTTLNSKFKEKSLIPKGTSRQSRANNI